MFLSNRASPEARTVGYDHALLNSVSRSGELAMLATHGVANNVGGDLFRVPMNGGSPMTVTHGVTAADWSADGRELAVVLNAAGEARIELPPGNVVYRTAGLIGCVRVSRDDSRIAFIEHPVRGDDGGMVRVTDLHGRARTLSDNWPSVAGLAWSADGNEVWFTASRTGAVRSLWAVGLNGALRQVAKVPGSIRLHDVSRTGAVLVTYDNARAEMAGRFGDDAAERDLSWFDWSGAQDFSRDGTRLRSELDRVPARPARWQHRASRRGPRAGARSSGSLGRDSPHRATLRADARRNARRRRAPAPQTRSRLPRGARISRWPPVTGRG
jgi:hypothetical protein